MQPSTQITDRLSIADVRAAVRGQVIDPSDPGYDAARSPFYGGFDRRPAVIVRPKNAGEVAAIVNLAREAGVELAVRSGGHSVAGHSVSDGGIVLDLKDMRALEIDAGQRTAWVETGLTAGAYTQAADAHDFATGFGDTGSVGIGGITLGGGVGYLSRKYGLTIDSLLAAEIVTADGQLLRLDADHHPDLFWAIRGGGGNFGVVTRFRFRLHSLGQIYGGMLFLPATPEVIAGFLAAAEAAPDELSTIANIMPAPPMPFIPPAVHGKMTLMAMLVYAGDVESGKRVIAPFQALANPLADMIRPMRYPEMFPPEDDSNHPTAVAHTMFMDHVGQAEAETILHYLQNCGAPMCVTQVRPLGGAIARVPAEATAYAHRQARFMVNLFALFTGPEDRIAREEWLKGFATAMQPTDQGAYVNFMGENGAERVRAAYPGTTYERLSRIKARYDPANLFHLNQNISPAGRSS